MDYMPVLDEGWSYIYFQNSRCYHVIDENLRTLCGIQGCDMSDTGASPGVLYDHAPRFLPPCSRCLRALAKKHKQESEE